MLPEILRNKPDEYEAKGPFVIRPEWPGHEDDEDGWEVARPTTKRGRIHGIHPGSACICRDRATAEAIRDALNAAEASG